MKVKSESEVAQLCPTLGSHIDRSLPGSSCLGIFQARVLEWGSGHEFEQILGDSERQGSLVCCRSQRVGHDLVIEQQHNL